MTFIHHVLGPIISTMKEDEKERGFNIPAIIGSCESYRTLFSTWFDKAEMKLEDLSQEKKVELKEQSKVYCPTDRLRWCKAIEFYKSF